MSERERRIVITILAVLLPIVSFLAGYFTNDYVAFVRGNQPVAGIASAAGGEMALFNEAWQLVNDNFLGEMPPPEKLSYALIRGAMASLDLLGRQIPQSLGCTWAAPAQ